jgi:anti-sigma regulatory factor (Ser/Thr protein kinase)
MSDDQLAQARKHGSSLQLTVKNELAALEPARQTLLRFLAPFELPTSLTFDVELVLEESLMNFVRHAFKDDAVHDICLSVHVLPDRVTLRFEDEGIAFDPSSASRVPRPTSLEAALPGGLGLLLVRKRAGSINYERRGNRNYTAISIPR